MTSSTPSPLPLTPCRSVVVVRASAEESRRAVLGGMLAGVAALAAAGSAQADVTLFDERKARERGFDLIYEARNLELPQGQRDGMSQVGGAVAGAGAGAWGGVGWGGGPEGAQAPRQAAHLPPHLRPPASPFSLP